MAPAESEAPPSLTREHRGLSPNCVPQYNQGYGRNIIPGCFRCLLGGGFCALCRTPLQPGIDVNVCLPTPQRRWGVRTVWRLSANLGYPGTDYIPQENGRAGRAGRELGESWERYRCLHLLTGYCGFLRNYPRIVLGYSGIFSGEGSFTMGVSHTLGRIYGRFAGCGGSFLSFLRTHRKQIAVRYLFI